MAGSVAWHVPVALAGLMYGLSRLRSSPDSREP
jgi:hypothetical protein